MLKIIVIIIATGLPEGLSGVRAGSAHVGLIWLLGIVVWIIQNRCVWIMPGVVQIRPSAQAEAIIVMVVRLMIAMIISIRSLVRIMVIIVIIGLRIAHFAVLNALIIAMNVQEVQAQRHLVHKKRRFICV
jgi:hypothetical protein